MGILHFYVNGVDQGPAAFNIPEHVFGVIGLVNSLICDIQTCDVTESNATVFACKNVFAGYLNCLY